MWETTAEGPAFSAAVDVATAIRQATRRTDAQTDPWLESNGSVIANQIEGAIRLAGNTMQVRERAGREARYHEAVVRAEGEAIETEGQFEPPEQTEVAPIRVRVQSSGKITPTLVECSLSITLLKD